MKNNNENFLIFLSCSIALHLVVIYFFLFGLPSFFEKLPEEQVIVFEMLPVSNKSNVPTQKKQHEKSIENEEAKKVEQSKPDVAPIKKPIEPPIEEKKIVEKPVEEKKPIEKPAEEKKPIEKVVEEKKPVETKPAEEKKPTEKSPEEKKAPVKKEAKKPKEVQKKIPTKSDLDSLLKNLEQSSEGNNAKSNKQKRTEQANADKESKGTYDENLPLSISEMALIKQQIEKHWNIPIGAQNLDQVRVILYIALKKDGSVEEVRVVDKICNNISNTICQALADSAVRAVWQASPIENLTEERYSTWKEIKLGFDPSKM